MSRNCVSSRYSVDHGAIAARILVHYDCGTDCDLTGIMGPQCRCEQPENEHFLFNQAQCRADKLGKISE
jgi:hypothetical protein